MSFRLLALASIALSGGAMAGEAVLVHDIAHTSPCYFFCMPRFWEFSSVGIATRGAHSSQSFTGWS